MVHYQRYHQFKKGEEKQQHGGEDYDFLALMYANSGYYRRTRPKLFYLVILSLLSTCLILAPHLFCSSSAFSLLCKLAFILFSLMGFLYFFFFLTCLSGFLADFSGLENEGVSTAMNVNASLCSSVSNGKHFPCMSSLAC